MKNILLLFLIGGLLMCTSCAKHLYVDYQSDPSNTGKIVLMPNKPTGGTFVTINDKLIVNKKIVKSVTISNVPKGNYEINYTSENSMYKTKLDAKISVKVNKNDEITKLIEVPPYSTGYYIRPLAKLNFNIFKVVNSHDQIHS